MYTYPVINKEYNKLGIWFIETNKGNFNIQFEDKQMIVFDDKGKFFLNVDRNRCISSPIDSDKKALLNKLRFFDNI
jgi:hypothetical protein